MEIEYLTPCAGRLTAHKRAGPTYALTWTKLGSTIYMHLAMLRELISLQPEQAHHSPVLTSHHSLLTLVSDTVRLQGGTDSTRLAKRCSMFAIAFSEYRRRCKLLGASAPSLAGDDGAASSGRMSFSEIEDLLLGTVIRSSDLAESVTPAVTSVVFSRLLDPPCLRGSSNPESGVPVNTRGCRSLSIDKSQY
jgi:hypothetical protein